MYNDFSTGGDGKFELKIYYTWKKTFFLLNFERLWIESVYENSFGI